MKVLVYILVAAFTGAWFVWTAAILYAQFHTIAGFITGASPISRWRAASAANLPGRSRLLTKALVFLGQPPPEAYRIHQDKLRRVHRVLLGAGLVAGLSAGALIFMAELAERTSP